VDLPETRWLGDADRLVGEIEEFLTGGRSGPAGEGVLAIVLFNDVVKSTERLAEVGDRAWAGLLDRYEESVRSEIARFRGREVFTKGDDLAGLAVHIAALVMTEAQPGELLVSSTVRDLIVGTGMRFTELPQHEDEKTTTDRLTVALARQAPGLMRRVGNWQWRRAMDKADRSAV
jgi:class 3 adenylate cyclase